MTKSIYRKGPVGALMDEYERAVEELTGIILAVPQDEFVQIADPDTKDPDCHSVQTIMNHVVRAGYGYANNIRKQFGNGFVEQKKDYQITSPADAGGKLEEMMAYTVETLEDKWDLTDEELMSAVMHTAWGQDCSMDQLLEHAIVHVLRHRRQIERFGLLK